LPFGVVATGTSYREVYRLQRFTYLIGGACSAMVSGSAETSDMDPAVNVYGGRLCRSDPMLRRYGQWGQDGA
jgi:hypothetical protein